MSEKNLMNKFVDHLSGLQETGQIEDGVYSIIVFGSYGRGDFNQRSDLDICIIAEFPENESPWERIKRYKHLLLPDGVFLGDIACYTREEIFREFDKGYGLAISIADEGKPLVDDGTFRTMKTRFNQLEEQGLERTKFGYIMKRDQ